MNTGEVTSNESCLAPSLDENDFCKHRIDLCDVLNLTVIKNTTLNLPSTILTKSEQTITKNSELKTKEKIAKSALLCQAYRGNLILSCCLHEVSEYLSDLINGGPMYYSSKSTHQRPMYYSPN